MLDDGKPTVLTTLETLNKTRNYHTACGFKDKFIFVIGGDNGSVFGSYLSTVHRFDLEFNKFSDELSLNHPRRSAGSLELGAYIYAVGGHNGAFLSSIERLDVEGRANSWEVFDVEM